MQFYASNAILTLLDCNLHEGMTYVLHILQKNTDLNQQPFTLSSVTIAQQPLYLYSPHSLIWSGWKLPQFIFLLPGKHQFTEKCLSVHSSCKV